MSLILNIDTSQENAFVAISEKGLLINYSENNVQKDHAVFIHSAVKNLMRHSEIKFEDIDAIAVTSGPGSYTGLRVGMATAKGFAYALKKPLITIGTLELMAFDFLEKNNKAHGYICPMIDARRMEVFTAVYDINLQEICPAFSLVLSPESYSEFLSNNFVNFLGSGADKWQNIVNNSNALFHSHSISANSMCSMSAKKFTALDFASLALCEPLYIKEFHNNEKK
jgi:tRNA threonylcarbamoyladenosine biosynthesis protein TsaB